MMGKATAKSALPSGFSNQPFNGGSIAERHGNEIDRLLDALIAHECSSEITKAEAGTGQPANRSESRSKGGDKPQQEARRRSR